MDHLFSGVLLRDHEMTRRSFPDQRSQIDIPWSAMSQRVEGLLPIFEEYVAVSKNGKVERKTKILDYAKMCDLNRAC